MPKTIIIFFSSIKEANALLYQSNLKFKKKNDIQYICLYKEYKIKVIITGIGKDSINNLENEFSDIFFIIKAGTCAVIDNSLSLGIPIIPLFVGYNGINIPLVLSKLPSSIKKRINKMIIKKGLSTLDEPLSAEDKAIILLQNDYAFADMETFFIIDKFKKYPVIPILVCTDRGNKDAKKDFLKMITKASEVLKKVIINIIGDL
ncbi:MAG: hypothetical protein KAT05_13320 [Spirochaetes bacterium]|nr:hypothetical protein [Spirochaetota bacterium]